MLGLLSILVWVTVFAGLVVFVASIADLDVGWRKGLVWALMTCFWPVALASWLVRRGIPRFLSAVWTAFKCAYRLDEGC